MSSCFVLTQILTPFLAQLLTHYSILHHIPPQMLGKKEKIVSFLKVHVVSTLPSFSSESSDFSIYLVVCSDYT